MSRKAFTLIELLVVIGIIAVLVAILMPTLALARSHANRVSCRARLHDIGASFQMYLVESKGKLPAVDTLPSHQPPLSANPGPTLPMLLKTYGQSNPQGWLCPMDHIIQQMPGTPSGYLTYYDREGSSYQYNAWLADFYAGKQLQDARAARYNSIDQLPVVTDYDNFHGAAGTNGAMNFLFADMHVGDPVGL